VSCARERTSCAAGERERERGLGERWLTGGARRGKAAAAPTAARTALVGSGGAAGPCGAHGGEGRGGTPAGPLLEAGPEKGGREKFPFLILLLISRFNLFSK
jgi:hypothetical protein